MEKEYVKKITKKSKDFAKWYTDVITRAELADYAPVKGCMVIRPYGFKLWENIQKILDLKIKKEGVPNAYFPLFIPESFLRKESEHVEGFAPEVAWVTHGGGKKLKEKLAIRPTSETIIYSMFSRWIQSYRDLPLKVNQWANIVRWEMRTRLFIRTAEFLWQEGHTAYGSLKEADKDTIRMLEMYQDFCENYLAIPVVIGKKSELEKFAGALYTTTVEALMTDGKALQMGTSHNLGQNFSKPFEIEYLDREGKRQFVWQTSWGVSTRLIGGIIMAHGDNQGLISPPRVAPIQIIIIPIWANSKEKKAIGKKVDKIRKILGNKFRIEVDSCEEYTPGWKFNQWELKGVPLRLEIGPKDIQKNQIVLVRRDNREEKIVEENKLFETVNVLLKDIQKSLFKKAKKFQEDNTHKVDNFDQFKKIIDKNQGFIKAYWCGEEKCEQKIKDLTGASIRCIPLKQESKTGKCIKCGKKSKDLVYFARAY